MFFLHNNNAGSVNKINYTNNNNVVNKSKKTNKHADNYKNYKKKIKEKIIAIYHFHHYETIDKHNKTKATIVDDDGGNSPSGEIEHVNTDFLIAPSKIYNTDSEDEDGVLHSSSSSDPCSDNVDGDVEICSNSDDGIGETPTLRTGEIPTGSSEGLERRQSLRTESSLQRDPRAVRRDSTSPSIDDDACDSSFDNVDFCSGGSDKQEKISTLLKPTFFSNFATEIVLKFPTRFEAHIQKNNCTFTTVLLVEDPDWSLSRRPLDIVKDQSAQGQPTIENCSKINKNLDGDELNNIVKIENKNINCVSLACQLYAECENDEKFPTIDPIVYFSNTFFLPGQQSTNILLPLNKKKIICLLAETVLKNNINFVLK